MFGPGFLILSDFPDRSLQTQPLSAYTLAVSAMEKSEDRRTRIVGRELAHAVDAVRGLAQILQGMA